MLSVTKPCTLALTSLVTVAYLFLFFFSVTLRHERRFFYGLEKLTGQNDLKFCTHVGDICEQV